MTTRSKSTFLASVLTSALAVPAMLVGSVAFLAPAIAEAGVSKASCRVHAVEASTEGDGEIPKELDFMADQLRAPQFAAYKSYALVGVKDFELEVGKELDKKFKSGHSVKLTLLGGEKGKLELGTKILRGNTQLFEMEFALGSQLVLVPVTRGESTVIFAYRCKS